MPTLVYSEKMLKGQPHMETILTQGCEWKAEDWKALPSRNLGNMVTWWISTPSAPV